MKKTLSVFTALALLMLCACGRAPVSVPTQTSSVQETYIPAEEPISTLSFFLDNQALEKKIDEELLCRVEYSLLKLKSRDAEKFPYLKSALDGINNAFISGAQSVFSQLGAEAAQSRKDNSENFLPFKRGITLTLPRADSKVVSILCAASVFSGGEGADVSYSSFNCDSSTGREIDIRKVVSSLPQLRGLIEQLLPARYPKVEFTDMNGSLNRFMEDPTTFVWTLDYQGITLYFNPYELAGAEAGLLVLPLRYDSYPELFDKAYTEIPVRYSVPFAAGQCFNVDLDMNGISDKISVTDSYNEALGYFDTLTISVNGKTLSTKTGLKSYECYLVHTGLGRDFLFLNGNNLSEYGYINVYKLDRNGASFAAGLYETSLYAAAYSGYCEGRPLLTNPDSFIMGTKCPLLHTMAGIKSYHIGTDGTPESDENYYLLTSSQILTSRRELATVSIDPATGSGNQAAVKLPSGTEYYFWRTDGSSLVDMKTSEGVFCRLFVTTGGGQKVNGINAAELFDGLS